MKTALRKLSSRLWLALGPVAVAAVFVTAFVLGILIHLPLPPSRRLATRIIMEQASKAIRGSIEIGRISRISLHDVEALEVVIRDPDREIILHAPRVQAHADLLAIGLSFLPWSPRAEIPVTWARADRVDVVFRNDASETLSLATTFLALEDAVPSTSSFPLILNLMAIEIGTIAVGGGLGGLSSLDWTARSVRGSVLVEPGGVVIDTNTFPLSFNRILKASIRTTVDYHFRSPNTMWSNLTAKYHDIAVSGVARLDGTSLHASLALPSTDSAALAPLLPDSVALTSPIEGTITAHGPIPTLDTQIHLASDRMLVDAKGKINLAPVFRTNLEVALRHIDLRSIVRGAPQSDIDADLQTRFMVGGDGRARVRLAGDVSPTVLEGIAVPGMTVEMLMDSKGASGTAQIHEPGMPVHANISYAPSEGLRIKAAASAPSLLMVPRLQGAVSGYAIAEVNGSFNDGALDARLEVRAGNLARDSVQIRTADVVVMLSGPPEELRMNGSVRATGAGFDDKRWSLLNVGFQGPLLSPQVRVQLQDSVLPNLSVAANLDMRRQFFARDVRVRLEHGQEVVAAATDLIKVRNGVVDFGAVALDGFGTQADAVAAFGPKGFDVRLLSDSIDIDLLNRIVPVPGPKLTGTASIDIDLRNVKDETSGCVRLDVQNAAVHSEIPVVGIDLSLRAQFTGRHIDLLSTVVVGAEGQQATQDDDSRGACLADLPKPRGGIAVAQTQASVALAGNPLEASSWIDATGTGLLNQLDIDFNRFDETYGAMMRLAGTSAGALSSGLRGKVSITGKVERSQRDSLPACGLTARATNVRVGVADSAIESVKANVFASINIDSSGKLHAKVCAKSKPGTVEADFCDSSNSSALASAEFNASVDYNRLIHEHDSWKQVLQELQFDGRLLVYDRPGDELLAPFALRTKLPIRVGHASANVAIHGTPLDPSVTYNLHVARLRTAERSFRLPMSICASGQYDGTKAWINADLRRGLRSQTADQACAIALGDQTTHIGTLNADVTAAWRDILAMSSVPQLPWVANAKLVIDDLDLNSVRALTDYGVHGRARLIATVKDLGKTPVVDVQLGISNLRSGSTVKYDQSHLIVRADEHGVHGSLAFVDVDSDGNQTSSLTPTANTEQVQWVDGWRLTRDGTKPVGVSLEANRFKLGLLSPVLHYLFSVVDSVDGDLTGRANAVWDPADGKSRFDALFFVIENGAFHLPLIGQEFLDVTGLIQATNSERIFLNRFQARSISGTIEARATIDLDELELRRIQASVWTKDSDRLRLTFAGISLGDMHGTVNVNIDFNDEQNDVEVAFENIVIDLPRSSIRNVQSLEAHDDIDVTPNLSVGLASTAPDVNVKPWVVRIAVGTPIELKRYDMNFAIDCSGIVLAYPDKETGVMNLSGSVVVNDGWIDVVGNRFEVETGHAWVTFHGDASDPQITVTVRYEAMDGTTVYADVTGSVSDPRIQFRSEPAMTQAAILALILFGPSAQGEGMMASGTPEDEGGSVGDTSASVGSGVASAGLNMLLKDISPSISTRIDTSRGQTPSPTLIYQVSRTVVAEGTYVVEDSSLDKTDRFLLTFDWRFIREWSLRVTRGNVGTSILDVIWQRRY